MSKDPKFICMKPCPLCGEEVQIFGSECYQSEGMTFECMNDDCGYEGTVSLSCKARANSLRAIAKLTHALVFNDLVFNVSNEEK